MARRVSRMLGAIGVLLWIAAASQAADLKKAVSDTESRKRAAENGLKEIKGKGQPSDEVRRAYIDAATQHNAWLESVCQAVEQGASAAPDVGATAQTAAASLVTWVRARNRSLGLPDLTGPNAEGVKQSVAQDLVEIATGTWRGNRSPDANKRANAAASLKTQLQWKSFDEV